MKSKPRHYKMKAPPVPAWWVEYYERRYISRQVELGRRARLIVSDYGTTRLEFLKKLGAYDRREIDHCLDVMVADGVLDRIGDLYTPRERHAVKGA